MNRRWKIGEGDHRPTLASSQGDIVVDLRAMRAEFEALSAPQRHFMLRDLQYKMEVMQNSVEKVERAAYGILVRGSEMALLLRLHRAPPKVCRETSSTQTISKFEDDSYEIPFFEEASMNENHPSSRMSY
ncbi:hypothetical protein MYU51_020703 [Penicillium brevicompactum]